jgi:hypothetical protein
MAYPHTRRVHNLQGEDNVSGSGRCSRNQHRRVHGDPPRDQEVPVRLNQRQAHAPIYQQKGYVVEYVLKSSGRVHYETVEDAHTPQAAVEAVKFAEGSDNVVAARAYLCH